MQETTSLSLLDRLRNDDVDGWGTFAGIYTPLIYSWCRQAGLDSATTADVVQEVLVAVHRNCSQFRKEKASDTFRGWLWSITRNKICDHFRKIGENPPLSGGSTVQALIQQVPEEEPATMSTLSRDRKQSLLARALALVQSEFETKTWQAFWQSKIDEIPTADVAQQLGMSPGAVRKARHRILARLREELGDLI